MGILPILSLLWGRTAGFSPTAKVPLKTTNARKGITNLAPLSINVFTHSNSLKTTNARKGITNCHQVVNAACALEYRF